MFSKKIISLAAVVVGLAFTSLAKADIVPTLMTHVADGAHAGDFIYTYDVTLSAAETLTSGAFFTLYDFTGLVAGLNTQPANWNYSTHNIGITPSTQLPADNASLPNVTWAYSGPTVIPGSGPVDLGTFTLDSTNNVIFDRGAYAAEAQAKSDGSDTQNDGSVQVPTPPNVIPLAAADWMGLSGLAVVVVFVALRRRRQLI